MDYENKECPYDVGQLLIAKHVFNWAVEQEELAIAWDALKIGIISIMQ